MYGPGTRIIDLAPRFGDFADATIELRAIGESHAEVHFVAHGSDAGPMDICFLSVEYLDAPSRMEEVRLRMATDAENESLRSRVGPGRGARYFDSCWEEWGAGIAPRFGHLAIECQQGCFSVWAGGVFVSPGDALRPRFLRIPTDPLWPGAPRLRDL